MDLSQRKGPHLNWRLYLLFVAGRYDECSRTIEFIEKEQQEFDPNGLLINEYAKLIKSRIKRCDGDIQASLDLSRECTRLDPANVASLKVTARSLTLTGKFQEALELYGKTLKYAGQDWEIFHNMALCYVSLKDYSGAEAHFREALSINGHDETYLSLGNLYVEQENYEGAMSIFQEAHEASPDNIQFMIAMGHQLSKLDKLQAALDITQKALDLDPKNLEVLLLRASLLQDSEMYDDALLLYRVAFTIAPDLPSIWNNIGMCFYGKNKITAAIACLKHALYLAPFEWLIAYNLALCHVETGQLVSAYHYVKQSSNLQPDKKSEELMLKLKAALEEGGRGL
ncbi:hypothetical protein HDV05_007727 [Chytridiales sp. JEL 0842]|nr:hypothetical protein HDV05_007727 [Chytridiales sp. JEL 0842]